MSITYMYGIDFEREQVELDNIDVYEWINFSLNRSSRINRAPIELSITLIAIRMKVSHTQASDKLIHVDPVSNAFIHANFASHISFALQSTLQSAQLKQDLIIS